MSSPPTLTAMNQPDLRPISDTHYRLMSDFFYQWEHEGNLYSLRIPAGYVTDMASVPRWAWTISGIRPEGIHEAAALVHDKGYGCRGLFPEGDHAILEDGQWQPFIGRWTRRQLDELFARMMRDYGVKPWRRRLMFLAVRGVGRFYW